DAKLLGLIPLQTVIQAAGAALDQAPKLVERLGYGAVDQAAGATIEAVIKTIKDALDTLRGLGDALFSRLDKTTANVRIADLYPRLTQRTSDFRTAVEEATTRLPQVADLASLASVLTPVVAAGRALLAELERTIQNPVPPVVQERLLQLTNAWATLKSAVEQGYESVGAQMHELMRERI